MSPKKYVESGWENIHVVLGLIEFKGLIANFVKYTQGPNFSKLVLVWHADWLSWSKCSYFVIR